MPVPAEFVAEILKWYSVFATSPAAIDAETAAGEGIQRAGQR